MGLETLKEQLSDFERTVAGKRAEAAASCTSPFVSTKQRDDVLLLLFLSFLTVQLQLQHHDFGHLSSHRHCHHHIITTSATTTAAGAAAAAAAAAASSCS